MLYKTAFYSTGISFILGTLLLVAFLCNQSDALAITGFVYVIAAAIVNLIILVLLIKRLFKDRDAFFPIGVLLLNIPVAIFYFYIVVNNLSFE